MLFEYKVKLNHGCHYRLACVILRRMPTALSFDHDLRESLTGHITDEFWASLYMLLHLPLLLNILFEIPSTMYFLYQSCSFHP